MTSQHQCIPGEAVDLSTIPTDGREFCDSRKEAEEQFEQLREELIGIQPRLYAEGRQQLLIVLQAMDAGGKDGTIRKVFTGVNPQGVRVASFKAPSLRELAHDFLWRVHREVPGKGQIGIFNRSHYEDVLVVRVDGIAPREVWEPRFDQINDFEKLLTQTGTKILKFYLHISRDEQRERLQDRLDDPAKHYKFLLDDLAKRAQWEAYRSAYEDALTRCTTAWAPWHVIPADRKWYRNLAVSQIIVDALHEMNPQFPTTDFDPRSITIEK